MSLDVYLELPEPTHQVPDPEPRIFIREDGQTQQISRAEWDARNPGREPVTVPAPVYRHDTTVYHANITETWASARGSLGASAPEEETSPASADFVPCELCFDMTYTPCKPLGTLGRETRFGLVLCRHTCILGSKASRKIAGVRSRVGACQCASGCGFFRSMLPSMGWQDASDKLRGFIPSSH